MRRLYYLLLLALPFCSACASMVDTGQGLHKASYHFRESMRWGDYAGAGMYINQDVRQEFLDHFPQDDDDLRIVGSEFETMTLSTDGLSAKADYLLEYYRLPSSRVKKWRWSQDWQHYGEKKLTDSGFWLIRNAPPPMP